MTEQPIAPAAQEQTDEPPTFAPPSTPPPGWRPPRQRLRDRLYRFRSLLAVGLAGVILGAGAGAGLTAIATSGSDGGQAPGRGQFPGEGRFGPGQRGQLPGPGVGPGTLGGQQGGSSG